MSDPEKNGDDRERGLPAVPFTVEQQQEMGMLTSGPPGALRRRADLDFGQQINIPPSAMLSIKAGGDDKYRENMASLQDQLLGSVGFVVMQTIITNPQTRLIPVVYNVKSVRHDIDIRVAFWEMVPDAKGVWGKGMQYTEEAGKIPGSGD